MDDTRLPAETRAAIKGATRDLMSACGTLARVAALTGRSKTQAQRWGDLAAPDLIPIDAALVLEADCGRPYLTATLAEIAGHALAPLVGDAATSDATLLAGIARATEAGAAVTRAAAEALADGVMTPREREDIRNAASEAHAAHLELSGAAAGAEPLRVIPGTPRARR